MPGAIHGHRLPSGSRNSSDRLPHGNRRWHAWICRASLFPGTETCAGTTPLAPGQATTFLVQTLVLARPGTMLTSTADVTQPGATGARQHASDTTRVQR